MPACRLAAFILTIGFIVAAPLRIVLVGDSTVNDEGGWGPGFAASFAGHVETINLAKNGRSSKSFRDEGLWGGVLEPKPDYVLIQFGHNDGPGKGPERETETGSTFRANLERYVEEVRAAGAKPVLVTSIVRRNFDENGKLRRDSLVPYVDEVRRLGAELRVPVMDLFALTFAQTEALGPKNADRLGTALPDGKPDMTHLGPQGQLEIGVMAARELVRVVPALAAHIHDLVSWNQAMGQKPEWYASMEAERIADNLLLHQHENGGWLKNIDMAMPPGLKERASLAAQRSDPQAETTFDNGATWTQLQFLARVCTAAKQPRFADAFRRGFRFVLAAQYANGGWPQFYPLRKGYYSHITFNDDAMTGVINTLNNVAELKPDYLFMTGAEREQAKSAVARGLDVILKSQILIEGKRTVWCAQHDEVTLAPVTARTYELPSFSGSESAGLVRLLMDIQKPEPEVVNAIENAVAWFRTHAVRGIRLKRKPDGSAPSGFDTVVVQDPDAPPLWARFYDLGTGEPFFCGRDGVAKKTIAEIEYERRNGYAWYTDRPLKLLEQDYPAWRTRVAGAIANF